MIGVRNYETIIPTNKLTTSLGGFGDLTPYLLGCSILGGVGASKLKKSLGSGLGLGLGVIFRLEGW